MEIKRSKKSIGIFTICMFSIIAVDSIRALPINAAYGPQLVGILILGAILFLLPCAFISAELASTWPEDGGIYVWVKEAFGLRAGFVANWLLWIYNLVWFPTIMAFICASVGSVFMPHIMQHKIILLTSMLVLFWLVTFINCLGIRGTSFLSTLGTIVGTLIPIVVIIGLTLDWHYGLGKASAVKLTLRDMIPSFSYKNIGLIPSMVFGLVGIEVAASFAGQVKNPRRNFPVAMFISSAVILASLILGSLALVLVVPADKLNLATGVIQGFNILFAELKVPYLINWMVFFIFIGAVGGLSTWMAGPSRNMMIAAKDGVAPEFLSKTNKFGAASNMLLLQALLFSVICFAYVLFPRFNTAYILLSDMTGQLAILVYLFIFAAVIRLRYTQKDKPRPFKLAGGNLSIWLVAGIAWLTCAAVFVVGFIPPQSLKIISPVLYEAVLIIVIVLAILGGLFFARVKR